MKLPYAEFASLIQSAMDSTATNVSDRFRSCADLADSEIESLKAELLAFFTGIILYALVARGTVSNEEQTKRFEQDLATTVLGMSQNPSMTLFQKIILGSNFKLLVRCYSRGLIEQFKGSGDAIEWLVKNYYVNRPDNGTFEMAFRVMQLRLFEILGVRRVSPDLQKMAGMQIRLATEAGWDVFMELGKSSSQIGELFC